MPIQQSVKLYLGTLISFSTKWVLNSYDVNEICSASPFSGAITEEEIYPTLPSGLNGALDSSRVKTYLKNSLYPLMHLFGKNSMPDVDNLLTSFISWMMRQGKKWLKRYRLNYSTTEILNVQNR